MKEPVCKPGSVPSDDGGNHSSWPCVTARLQRPTRGLARTTPCRSRRPAPLFGLAPGGVYPATDVGRRGALLPHLFTLTGMPEGLRRRYVFCGTFRRLTPPRRYLAPCPAEPGLSSISTRDTATARPALAAECRALEGFFQVVFAWTGRVNQPLFLLHGHGQFVQPVPAPTADLGRCRGGLTGGQIVQQDTQQAFIVMLILP